MNSCYVLAPKQQKGMIWMMSQKTESLPLWYRPTKSHESNPEGCTTDCLSFEGAIINLLFVPIGWMASMLSLAAWPKEWKWSRKWSRSVPGLGEPPRGSLSQTVGSSSRLLVSSGHGQSVISCCHFNVKEVLSSVTAQSATSLCSLLVISVTFGFLASIKICFFRQWLTQLVVLH